MEWLEKQKEKLARKKKSEQELEEQSERLVEELRSKQSSWKREEKSYFEEEDSGTRKDRKETSGRDERHICSVKEGGVEDSSKVLYNPPSTSSLAEKSESKDSLTLHPIQITDIGGPSKYSSRDREKTRSTKDLESTTQFESSSSYKRPTHQQSTTREYETHQHASTTERSTAAPRDDELAHLQANNTLKSSSSSSANVRQRQETYTRPEHEKRQVVQIVDGQSRDEILKNLPIDVNTLKPGEIAIIKREHRIRETRTKEASPSREQGVRYVRESRSQPRYSQNRYTEDESQYRRSSSRQRKFHDQQSQYYVDYPASTIDSRSDRMIMPSSYHDWENDYSRRRRYFDDGMRTQYRTKGDDVVYHEKSMRSRSSDRHFEREDAGARYYPCVERVYHHYVPAPSGKTVTETYRRYKETSAEEGKKEYESTGGAGATTTSQSEKERFYRDGFMDRAKQYRSMGNVAAEEDRRRGEERFHRGYAEDTTDHQMRKHSTPRHLIGGGGGGYDQTSSYYREGGDSRYRHQQQRYDQSSDFHDRKDERSFHRYNGASQRPYDTPGGHPSYPAKSQRRPPTQRELDELNSFMRDFGTQTR